MPSANPNVQQPFSPSPPMSSHPQPASTAEATECHPADDPWAQTH